MAVTALATTTTEAEVETTVSLARGRVLSVNREGHDDVVEVRAANGAVEVRITLTDTGPVLTMDAAVLRLAASERIELAAPVVAVAAAEKLELATEGEARITAAGDVAINGKMIYLNS